MMVLYVWDVDVYEDEPLRVMAFTAAWGIVAGVIVGLVDPAAADGDTSRSAPRLAIERRRAASVLVPLVERHR